jgi:hypothetical protein
VAGPDVTLRPVRAVTPTTELLGMKIVLEVRAEGSITIWPGWIA